MERKRQKAFWIAGLILLDIVLMGALTYAWFAGSTLSGTTSYLLDSESLEIPVTVYSANDFDRNGVPEYPEDFDAANATHAQLLEEGYTVVDRELGKRFQRCLPGEFFTYRIVIQNTEDYPVDVSITINDLMKAYLAQAKEIAVTGTEADNTLQTDTDLTEYLESNCARIMFSIVDRSISIYDADDTLQSLKNGALTAAGADAANTVELSENKYLWTAGEAYEIVSYEGIPAGYTMEFDFKIRCMDYGIIENSYRADLEAYMTAHQITETSSPNRSQMLVLAAKELEYVANNSGNEEMEGASRLGFSIEYFSIRITQRQ